ncbi:hypothetical protein [Halobacteriovorax sp. JY17]|uniref:PulJ/GspJ family protein n=1 Tax=Halobacteriovorax sp. JY17 TaxID=2014617 RepID=UPI000C551877|nr:hypothetical protein [Halobacteriovorax sp. JY17]PIK14038.1 MAG: hypothetical protein CES88_13725 [Halobacteriovorax sp. JY17]
MAKRKFLSNSSGFTLAEVVVAAGMLGVVSLGVTQLMGNMTKGQRKLTQDSTVSSVTQRAEMLLRREHNCSANLRGLSVDSGSWTNLPNLVRATNNWSRSNGDDTPGNKVEVLASDTLYGGASGSVRLKSIDFRGYYQSGSTIYGDDASYGNGAESSYTFDGDTKATDGGANTQRQIGSVVYRLTFERLGRGRDGTDAEAQEDFNKRSFGSETTVKFIESRVIANGLRVIQSCYGDNENFVEASCDTLDGTIENGDCKGITVKSIISNTAPAVTVSGNLSIEPDNSGGPADRGSVGIGAAINETSQSNLDVAGSVGVGMGSTGNPGDVSLQNSLGVGVAANSQSGDALINNSVAIGNGVTGGLEGTLRVRQGVTIGDGAGMPAGDGVMAVKRAVAIGSGVNPPNVDGGLAVKTSVAIGTGNNASGTNGTLDINNSASIGAGYNPNGVDGDLRVKKSFRAGTNAGNLGVGAIESLNGSKRVTISDGRITTSERYNSTASANALSQTDFVTREWVNWVVASTLKPTGAASTIANYLNSVTSEGDTYAAIKMAVCDSIMINGTRNMAGDCTVGNVGRMYSSYNATTNVIRLYQPDTPYDVTYTIKDCSQNGKCSNVYSNGWIKGSYVTALGRNSGTNNGSGSVTGSKICIGVNCRTTFGTQRCATGQNAVALGRGGTLGCAAPFP